MEKMNKILYKSRFLIAAIICSTIGVLSAYNLFFFLFFFALLSYSVLTLANRMDEYENKKKQPPKL